jgi:alginate O-acetyltransferase complex protein AlgI
MLFTSPLFLFLFLPTFFAIYFLVPDRWRNGFILAASLAFIFASSGALILILLFVIGSSFVFGLLIERTEGARRFALLAAGVTLTLLPLFYFKYFEFALTALNQAIAPLAGSPPFTVIKIARRLASRSIRSTRSRIFGM